mgnify:CR=1 FL=1
MFKNDIDIRDFRNHTHQDADSWVTKDTKHHNFVLNLLQELISETWIKDFLNGYGSSIQLTFMNDGETTLTNFLTYFNVFKGDFSNSWHWRQPSRIHRHISSLSECTKVLLLNLLFESFNLVHHSFLIFLFSFNFILKFSNFCTLGARSHWSFDLSNCWPTSCSASDATHPVAIIVSHSGTSTLLKGTWQRLLRLVLSECFILHFKFADFSSQIEIIFSVVVLQK